jgi:dipeptidyl aminopeptidase/acylaminoacyl peptidase
MCIEPTWSPDGRVLAYTYRDNADYQPESVWIVNVDGTNPHLLVDLAFDPQWAVQGNQITVSRLKSFTDNLETFLVQVDLGQH